jgi:undecaprenyl pyrophosphate phosphatase UppP
MRVVPFLLGWRDPGSAFSAAMQMTALAAVVSYFWRAYRRKFAELKKVSSIFKKPGKRERSLPH